MSERKVLTKYYPPDFDPSAITRTRGPKQVGPRQITVRLMAPFSMKCTTCGEYIYKGRKFNARKETAEEKYLGQIAVYRFYIRCTRCSAEISFRTDPKNMDYAVERGARRNFEAWRPQDEETDEAILDRLEEEDAKRRGDQDWLEKKTADAPTDKMEELERKRDFAKKEMEVADAIDALQDRNARIEARRKEGGDVVGPSAIEVQKQKEDDEDAEAARRAFQRKFEEMEEVSDEELNVNGEISTKPAVTDPSANGATRAVTSEEKEKSVIDMPPPTFKRTVKKKTDFGAKLGIKKKPTLV